MKRITTLLLLLFSLSLIGQTVYGKKDPADYVYGAFSFDPNMAFGIIDNEDTLAPDRGFDWDVEIGARDRHFGVYLFYGRFNEFNYQTYGTGVDYYVNWLRDEVIEWHNPFTGRYIGKLTDGIDLSLGVYTSFVLRQDVDGNWGSFWAYASPRGQVIIWNGNVGLLLVGKLQDRPELGKFKFEGNIGIIIKFDRN